MKKTKKILFVIPKMKTGGIQSSFLNLLSEISCEEYDIDVLCFDGDDIDKLPPYVNPIPSNRFLRMLVVSQDKINKENLFLGLFRLFCGACVKFFGQKYVYKLLFLTYKKLSGYDTAISFTQSPNRSLSGGFNEFVLYRVCAKQKIAFIHCDYKEAGINTPYSKYIYQKFDKIAAVSKGVKKALISECPFLTDKTYVVYNCHRIDNIREKSADNPLQYESDILNFVTVARISAEKGHIRMLDVLHKLKKIGTKFCWHVVGGGDGSIVSEFKNKIKSLELCDCVRLYGDQSNPYRFMKNADFLVVPSFHEAAPMVYGEARALGLPVITTRTASSQEFIENTGFGMVCDNSVDGLYNSLVKISNNKSILDEFKKNISSCMFTNETAKKHFLNMINDNIGE